MISPGPPRIKIFFFFGADQRFWKDRQGNFFQKNFPRKKLPVDREKNGVSRCADNRQIHVCANTEAAAACAAHILAQSCREAMAARGVFTLALSGGKTPVPLFRHLRRTAREVQDGDGMNWAHTRVFWADERCVPPEHPHSNFGLAWRELFAGLPAAPLLFRIRGEEPPISAAARYEQLLYSVLNESLQEKKEDTHHACRDVPRLDCVLLGMGRDGHTASLFPGSRVLEERRLVAVAEDSVTGDGEGGKVCRITLTLPVLRAARLCLFLVCGKEKHHMLRHVLKPCCSAALPAQLVSPTEGRLVWVLDAAAWQGKTL